MIDLTALLTSTGLTATPDKPAAQAGEGAQGADFLALLSAQTVVPGMVQPGDPVGIGIDPAVLPTPTEPASPAPGLPPTGKILPSALPQLPVLPETPVEADTPPQPAPQQPVPLALPLARVLLARLRQADPQAPASAADPAEPAEAAAKAEPALQPVEVAMPTLALATLAVSPAPPVLPADAPPALAAADPVLAKAAALSQLPMQVAPIKPDRPAAEAPAQAAPNPASPQPVLMVQAGAVQPAAAPLVQPQPAAARPAATLRVALSEDPVRPTTTPEPVLAPDSPAPVALAPFAAPDAGAPAPQAAPTTRPHEFGALVDRLVQAREALQPQAVTMAVQHAEFGPVQLHFRHEDSGLSVSLANADPDFARAVSAAVPPVLAAPQGDSAGLATGQRQDASPQTGSDSAERQRGQSAPGRDERAPSANPGRRSTPDQAAASTGQPGIYA